MRYAPAGTDATVVWGAKDLRFINTGANPVIIYSRLENKNGGVTASTLKSEKKSNLPGSR
ncbi:VanW family protein [Desulfallas sp. Bu1-1]|uniref:VanW family protein n=1 Tax=Desulfallas sp. Bu1-1 TaxID=2787620 RepID=UPI0037C11DB5